MLGLVAVFAHTAPGAAHDRADRTIRFQPDAAYAHRSVRMVEMGLGPKSYSIFLPAEPTPEARVPLVVFLHGWMGVNPAFYGAWIEHLCRKGSIVVFPRYQSDFGTPPAEFLPNTITAVRDAIDTLATAEHFSRPDLERVAFIGHSAGGNLAAQLAASAAGAGLPRPKAVVAVMPGEVEHQEEPRLSELPAEVLLLVMVGDRDWIVGDQRAREIYLETSRIRPENKEYLLFRTENHHASAFTADHLAPTAAQVRFDNGSGVMRSNQIGSARLTLIDRFGFWRAADLTLMAAFGGQSLDDASDHGALFCDLGRWENGKPIVQPISGDDLSKIPRVALPNGARLLPAPGDGSKAAADASPGG